MQGSKIISKDDIHIFKGKYYLPWFKTTVDEKTQQSLQKKVIVFDLDETLGSFADLYIIWCGIRQIWPDCKDEDFYELLNMYPEFLRYGIVIILEYLYNSKINNMCNKIFIYTNNQCSSKWVDLICNYLQTKVKANFPKSTCHLNLFDHTICAFKINKKQVNPLRSTHHKTMDDLISCTKLSEHADVCFIDDVDYPLMKNRKVYYIRPRAYIHPLNTQQIIQRILDNGNLIPKTLNLELLRTKEYWYNWFRLKKRGRSRVSNDVAIDIQISQKLICHLTEFLHFTPDYCSP